MAASVRIEDEAFSDGRVDHLGQLLGTSRFDALGRLACLWRQCTLEAGYVLPESFVRVFVDPDLLCEARLGERVDGGIRIRGTRGRIEWLSRLRKNGRKGGRPKKPNGSPSGSANGNQERTTSEPKSNPPAPAPAPAPAPVLRPVSSKQTPPSAVVVKAREEWDAYYREAHSSEATWSNTRLSKLKSLVTQHGLHEITRRLAVLRGSPPSFPPGPWDFDTFARHIDKCTGSRDDNRPATVWLNR